MIWAIAVCLAKSVPAEQAPRTGSVFSVWEHLSGRVVGRDANGGYLYEICDAFEGMHLKSLKKDGYRQPSRMQKRKALFCKKKRSK